MKNIPLYKYFLLFSDVTLFTFTMLLSEFFAGKWFGLDSVLINVIEPYDIISKFLLPLAIFIVILQSNHLYKINIFLDYLKHFSAALKSLNIFLVISVILSFVFQLELSRDSRAFVFFFSVLLLLNFLIIRIVLLRIAYRFLISNEVLNRRLVIVGAGFSGRRLANEILMNSDLGIEIIGFLDDHVTNEEFDFYDLEVLGRIDQINEVSEKIKFDKVIVCIDNTDYERMMQIIDTCASTKKTIKIASELFEVVPANVQTEYYGQIAVIDAIAAQDSTVFLVIKRGIDFFGSLFGIMLLSPIFLFLAIGIKLSSPGPVFYLSRRIGKDGKGFDFYKFRSMTIDSSDDVERQKAMIDFMKSDQRQNNSDSKIINQSRLTGIGKIIRKYSLDELPQLINVLKGEMSLVGPRPCLPYEYDNYDNWQRRRHDVLPGCTGVWQVFGRAKVSFKDSIVLDLYYINNMSPWLDIKLIFLTIPVMLFGKGGK